MKKIPAVAAVSLLVLLALSVAASPQAKRRSTSSRNNAAKAAAAAAEKKATEIQGGRARIAGQIKALTEFLFLFGGVSNGVESAEQARRVGDPSALSAQQIAGNRAKVIESVRTVRAGIDKLVANFRTNPALESYYFRIAGISALAETAEKQATANNFDAAGKSLISAVNQLTDVLAVMH